MGGGAQSLGPGGAAWNRQPQVYDPLAGWNRINAGSQYGLAPGIEIRQNANGTYGVVRQWDKSKVVGRAGSIEELMNSPQFSANWRTGPAPAMPGQGGGAAGGGTPAPGATGAYMPPTQTAGMPGEYTPPASGIPGNPAINPLIEDFRAQQQRANQANEARYADIKGQHEGQYTNIMGQLEGLGTQQKADVNTQYAGIGSRIGQDMVSRGLSGTTIAPTMAMGVERERQAAQSRLQEGLTRERLGYQTSLMGDKLAFMERRNDVGPDVGQFNALLNAYGQAGSPGGNGSVTYGAGGGASYNMGGGGVPGGGIGGAGSPVPVGMGQGAPFVPNQNGFGVAPDKSPTMVAPAPGGGTTSTYIQGVVRRDANGNPIPIQGPAPTTVTQTPRGTTYTRIMGPKTTVQPSASQLQAQIRARSMRAPERAGW